MIYTKLTKQAMKVAFEAHKEQTDKAGLPYIYHPICVAEKMDDEVSTCVALLHDVVEDSTVTFEELRELGFTEEMINVLTLLTHSDEEPYMRYIERIKENPIATKVKLADLAHNSDLSRLDQIDEDAEKRYKKYCEAIELLKR